MKKIKCNKRKAAAALSIILAATSVLGMAGCSRTATETKAESLMEGIAQKEAVKKEADDRFIASTADFSVELFKMTVADQKNSLVSPLSVMLALAMTANGADAETRTQMETLLGGTITAEELNEYLFSYVASLPNEEKSKLGIANSIWFREDENQFKPATDFLQTNADYYGTDMYKAPFDDQTLKDINSWVDENTDGLIDRILDKIDSSTMMYIFNAIVFDAEWERVYAKEDVMEGEFKAADGSTQNAEFMFSKESLYIETDKATGFIKPYAKGGYSFVALLPEEGMDMGEYIGTLTGDKFRSMVKGAEETVVNATMPKFSYEYEIKMNEALSELGMPDAFSPDDADFSRLGSSPIGSLYIGEVLHKTFIAVDELGTKAGAVTKVQIDVTSARDYEEVVLDRPFVYAIVDNGTGLPVFMGTVMSVE